MSSITENGSNIEDDEENNNINLISKDSEIVKKCDSKPTLVLKEFDSANTETDTDTLAFCPIPVTPKKLVDSCDQNGYDNNYNDDDDHYPDDDYYSDEEDELLYRFLDKSNEIVSRLFCFFISLDNTVDRILMIVLSSQI